jgi:hypothetical protein
MIEKSQMFFGFIRRDVGAVRWQMGRLRRFFDAATLNGGISGIKGRAGVFHLPATSHRLRFAQGLLSAAL